MSEKQKQAAEVDPGRSGNNVSLYVTLDPETFAYVSAQAAREYRSKSQQVRKIIRERMQSDA